MMKKLFRLLLFAPVFWFANTTGDVYVNPYTLETKFEKAQSVDKKLENAQMDITKSLSLQIKLWWDYKLCSFWNLPCMHETYVAARANDLIIDEITQVLQWYTEEQRTARFDYNECKEARAGCDKKPDPKPANVHGLIDYYADKYWLSRARVHRIAACESNYNPCAKYPITMSQNCTTSSRVQRWVSTASWVYQFINSTWDHYSYLHGRWWYDKYHAEANIATAMAMFANGQRSHRQCK